MSIPGQPFDVSKAKLQERVQLEKQSAQPRPVVSLSPEDRNKLQAALFALHDKMSNCTRLCLVFMHLPAADHIVKSIIKIVSFSHCYPGR